MGHGSEELSVDLTEGEVCNDCDRAGGGIEREHRLQPARQIRSDKDISISDLKDISNR